MLWNALRSGDIRTAFVTLALSLPAIVLCLSAHEAAHGGVAYLLGDRTARDYGRVTLSPLAHIDPWGFICLLLFGFGWARPVPVNVSNFKNKRLGMALTALAGPLANLLTAFIACGLFIWIFPKADISTNPFAYTVALFFRIVISMSVGLCVFNLIPVHPLDGSRVVDAFMPFSWSMKLQKYQQIIMLVFIMMLWFGWLDGVMSFVTNVVFRLSVSFWGLFF